MTDIVNEWVQHLEANLQDKQLFLASVAQLKRENLDEKTIKAIAKKFHGRAARSKPDAFGKIMQRRAALDGLQARADAVGGPSAA